MGAVKCTRPALEQQKCPWRTTPLVESASLSRVTGCRRSRIFLKLENLQPSGSFKSRGLGNLVVKSMQRAEERGVQERVHFYASSGGNAGLGCVFGAVSVGRPATIVVPTTTKRHMLEKLRDAGAEQVILHGSSIQEADTYLREVVMPLAVCRGEEPVYVSPFDHPDIWEGHSTMVDEIAEQLEEFDEGNAAADLLICSCGGGGLFNGLMRGIASQGPEWDKTRVLAVNTAGADALATSLTAGENTALSKTTSIATSLGCARVSEETYSLAREGRSTGRVLNTVLSDAEAVMGCIKLAEMERMLVEPACGVNLALCFGGRLKKVLGRPVRREEKVVIVVCGGSNVTLGMFEGWKEEYGMGVLVDADVGRGKEKNGYVSSGSAWGNGAVLPPNGHHCIHA